MENKPRHLDSLFEKASDYVETRIELAKLKITEKSSDVISDLASKVILISIVSVFVLMLNIGIGLWLGELLGKNFYGFFVLAGFYGIIALIFYSFKTKWIEEPVTNAIIKKMNK
ncbi:MAG: phage holin family protein [Gloeobacteraceae cyanobacterium ES-bin-316]|nr:phage holin family protein [Ferruginibacter sp.]